MLLYPSKVFCFILKYSSVYISDIKHNINKSNINLGITLNVFFILNFILSINGVLLFFILIFLYSGLVFISSFVIVPFCNVIFLVIYFSIS